MYSPQYRPTAALPCYRAVANVARATVGPCTRFCVARPCASAAADLLKVKSTVSVSKGERHTFKLNCLCLHLIDFMTCLILVINENQLLLLTCFNQLANKNFDKTFDNFVTLFVG